MSKKAKQTKGATKGSKATKVVVAKSPTAPRAPRKRDPRLPAAGTTLVRPYKGKDYRVTVLDEGFRYDGREFRSLSKLASEITGQASINGFLWMRLTGGAGSAAGAAAPTDAPKPKPGKPARAKRKPAATKGTAAPADAPATSDEVARAE